MFLVEKGNNKSHNFISGHSRVRKIKSSRSSRQPEVLFKKGVLENLSKFAVKHLCRSL